MFKSMSGTVAAGGENRLSIFVLDACTLGLGFPLPVGLVSNPIELWPTYHPAVTSESSLFCLPCGMDVPSHSYVQLPALPLSCLKL